MSVVDKVVFNCLVQYGNVALPQVGSLQVVGSPKRVEFTDKVLDNHIPVTEIIAEQGNISDEQALALYNDWLAGARAEDGTVTVEGVGFITPKSFTIADELRHALVGFEEEQRPAPMLKRRCRCGWLCWVLAIVAVVVVVGLLVCPKCCNRKAPAEVLTVVVEEAPVVEEVAVVEEPKVVATPPAANKRYNVAVGVFSIKYNARACAKQDPLGIGAENYTITPFPSGLWVVIAYASDNLNDAERMRKQYRKIQPDVWVYRRW